jgi:hypothetical protein
VASGIVIKQEATSAAAGKPPTQSGTVMFSVAVGGLGLPTVNASDAMLALLSSSEAAAAAPGLVFGAFKFSEYDPAFAPAGTSITTWKLPYDALSLTGITSGVLSVLPEKLGMTVTLTVERPVGSVSLSPLPLRSCRKPANAANRTPDTQQWSGSVLLGVTVHSC